MNFKLSSTLSSASAYLALQHNISLMKIITENLKTGSKGCHDNQDMKQHSFTQSRQAYHMKRQVKYRPLGFEGGWDWSNYGL